MTATPDVIAAAQAQVAMGFAAFALLANAKTPATEHGFKNATTKPDWIETQLKAASAGNYGITWPIEAPPVVGFDLDDGGGADRPWQDRLLDLIARLGPLPPTKSQTTPSDGRHVWYRWPADVPIPPGDELFGFTVRWPGRGYFVGPGSSINGREYTPGPESEIAMLPDAWVAAAVAEHPQRRQTVDGTTVTIAAGGYVLPDRIPSGRRYATVRDYVASRYNAGIGPDELWDLVRSQVAPRFDVPKAEDELRGDFDRVMTKITERLGPPTRTAGAGPVAAPRSAEEVSAAAIDAADLLELDIPPLQWIVRDLVPEGTTVLAGPPKLGKSCLVYQIATEVALGGELLGRPIDQGDVLYLALEDGKRRGQTRLRAALGDRLMPRRTLEVWWSASKLGAGLEEELIAWLDAHAHARLVAIDTLQRIRARGDARRNAYEVDVEDLARLQDIFKDRAVGLLVVHHSKKDAGDDFLASVSGTYGITGSADTTLVIQRKRLETFGKLVVTGRDVEEVEQAVAFSGMTWTVAPESLAQSSFEQAEVYKVLEASDEPLFAKAIADRIGSTREAVQRLLEKLVDSGAVVRVQGGYAVARLRVIIGGQGAEEANTTNSGDIASSASSRSRARAHAGVPTSSASSATSGHSREEGEEAGTRTTRAGAREASEPADPILVEAATTETIVCYFYEDHRFEHRLVDERWICPICQPDQPEAAS